jgi:LacI family transcriptional regulator
VLAFSVEKVAELTGFEHPEYLAVAFKREFGVPPGEFRRSRGAAGTPPDTKAALSRPPAR